MSKISVKYVCENKNVKMNISILQDLGVSKVGESDIDDNLQTERQMM